MVILGITTRDRPKSLTESLQSVVVTLAHQVNPPLVVVFDDAGFGGSTHISRQIVSAARGRTHVSVAYHGATERARLGSALFGSEEIRCATKFSSLPYTDCPLLGLGRNRNAALLFSAGGRLISLDDDALFSFSRFNEEAILPGRGEAKPQLYPDRQGSEDDVVFHEAIVSAAFAAQSQIEELVNPVEQNVYQTMMQSLDGSRVPVVMTGIRGNRWYKRPAHFFYATDPLRERCYIPKQQYQRNRLAGYAVFHVSRPVLTANPFHITCCHSCDARIMLPPYPPLGRREDTVFGMLVRYCYPESRHLHLPLAVDHTLSPPRPMPESEFSDVTTSFGDLTHLVLTHLSQAAPPQTLDPAERLRHLGTQLMELSQASHRDWLDLSHELTISAATREIEVLEQLKERHNNEPRWWARDVDDHIERLIAQSADPLNAVPRELRRAGYDPEQATEFHRTFCWKYGNLMIHWPEIFERARAANLARA